MILEKSYWQKSRERERERAMDGGKRETWKRKEEEKKEGNLKLENFLNELRARGERRREKLFKTFRSSSRSWREREKDIESGLFHEAV
jgi:hypothetical protein